MAIASQNTPKQSEVVKQSKTHVEAADLEKAFTAVQQEFATPQHDPWATSPYAWLRKLKSRRMGKAGEMIIESWLRSDEFAVGRADSSQADRAVNLHQVEIKLSTLWDTGVYKFQQIRDQEYSHAILLGVSPHRLHVWCVPKHVLMARSSTQHGGKNGSDTAWLTVSPGDVPDWLNQWGGTVESGLRCIRASLPRKTVN